MTKATETIVEPQRFNNRAGLMNPEAWGLYVRYEDHAALITQARLAAQPVVAKGELPAILFDSHAVYYNVMENDPHTPRPTADNVCDVLDAVVRLLRSERAALAAPVAAQADSRLHRDIEALLNDYGFARVKAALPEFFGAAATQADTTDILRDMLAIQEACGLHTDEYAPGSVIEYIKELEADSVATSAGEADTTAPAAQAVEARPNVRRDLDAMLRREVSTMYQYLEAGEWAEHLAVTPEGQCLETAITKLVGQAAQAQQAAAPVDWVECERIADLPAVDEALRGFSEDATGDNGTCVVRAVLEAIAAPGAAAAPPTCTVPSPGWHCTRAPGHDGPCAAHPVAEPAVTEHGHSEGGHVD